MEYTVNGMGISYEALGEKSWGDDKFLLQHAVDLTASTSWHSKGFTIEPFVDAKSFDLFQQQTRSLLLDCWKKAGLAPADDIRLDRYHTLVKNFNDHLSAVDKTKLLPVEEFPIDLSQLEG